MSDSYKCDICEDEFDSERGLKIHKGQKHPDEEASEDAEKEAEDESEASPDSDSSSVDENNNEESSGTVDLSFSVKQAMISVFVAGLFVGFTGGFMASSMDGGVSAPTGDSGDSGPQFETVEIGNISLDDDPSLGDADAPIKVIEFSDFGCPYCAEWHGVDASSRLPIDGQNNYQKLKDNFIDTGEVELIAKDYPVPNLHPNAVRAHAAANCAYDQSKDGYWTYADQLYEQRDEWTASGQNVTTETFNDIASGIEGIDQEEFTQCYLSADGSEMAQDKTTAINNLGRLGTPTFVIGNRDSGFVMISGAQPISKFEEAFNYIQS